MNLEKIVKIEQAKIRKLIQGTQNQQEQDTLATWFVLIPSIIGLVYWLTL